jgi:putative transposase
MYNYRKMSEKEREQIVAYRKECGRPLHAPPHRAGKYTDKFLISASCYEHKHQIGRSLLRLSQFESALLQLCEGHAGEVYSWCVLPNHYHILLLIPQFEPFMQQLGRLHGRTSYYWNKEDNTQGRKVWHRAFDREIRSEAHFWATMNYVHNNPVHRGYVDKWADWFWSSSGEFIERVGREKAIRIWFDYPVRDYGKGWDIT